MLPAKSECGPQCCTAAWARTPFSSVHQSLVPVSRPNPRPGWKQPFRWYRSALSPLTSSSQWSGSCPQTSSGSPPWLSGLSSAWETRVSALQKKHIGCAMVWSWRAKQLRLEWEKKFLYLQWIYCSLQFLQLLHPFLAFLFDLSLGDSQ